jgi:hypothetical protein
MATKYVLAGVGVLFLALGLIRVDSGRMHGPRGR